MDDITIYRGDTHTLRVTATLNNALIPLNNYTVYFAVWQDLRDATAQITKTVVVPATPAVNYALVPLSGSDSAIVPGDYTYEVVLSLAGEDMTIGQGKFTILLRGRK